MCKKMDIEKLYSKNKICWNKFYAYFHDGFQQAPETKFDIKPIEYLKFAKLNLQSMTKQSCVDAIGNIKRAIECQIDVLITSLGYDYKTFDSSEKYIETKNFLYQNYKGKDIPGIIPKLKLLNILGLAPTILISSIRNLRNKMEHEYTIPTYKEANEAIEVAELFIYSSTYKYEWTSTHILISNRDDFFNEKEDRCHSSKSYIILSYTSELKQNKCYIESNISEDEKYKIILTPEDKYYIDIIYALFNEDCLLLPRIFGSNIDTSYVKCKAYNV